MARGDIDWRSERSVVVESNASISLIEKNVAKNMTG